MGVGSAYLGVKVLLINRGKSMHLMIRHSMILTGPFSTDCKARISGIVNFVTGNLRPVKSDIDTELSSWYKENSRVFVAGDHACWSDPDLTRKVHKRRFGTVVRSQKFGLNKMMQAHAEQTQDWIMARVSENAEGDTTEEEKSS